MSALRVSRTGLPFSQLSATASISAFASITSAMALSTAACSVADASPQASLAAWAASRASSTSSGVDSATSVIGSAVAGVRSTRYLPCVGANHLPPMKFSYLGATETMLPDWPGGTYFISLLLQGFERLCHANLVVGTFFDVALDSERGAVEIRRGVVVLGVRAFLDMSSAK